MSKKKQVTLKIFAALALTDLLETFAQFCFKKSAISAELLKISFFGAGLEFVGMLVRSPFLWLGLFSVFVIFVLWCAILSEIDLSVAVPVASISYITIPLVSVIFLGEKISLMQWSGISFILFGIILVSLSTKTSEEL
ncbi:MAG: EamA family transporter [Candidatus Omnitrophica bacterium]|nr:EamA family transporter [Candidatus Omnitrophota bacterium]